MKNSKPLLAIVDRDCKTFDDTSDSILLMVRYYQANQSVFKHYQIINFEIKKTNKQTYSILATGNS